MVFPDCCIRNTEWHVIVLKVPILCECKNSNKPIEKFMVVIVLVQVNGNVDN